MFLIYARPSLSARVWVGPTQPGNSSGFHTYDRLDEVAYFYDSAESAVMHQIETDRLVTLDEARQIEMLRSL